ncbi:unnamed protein product [Parnassius apollo]|uniref:(apollo) hypothetical protein n=1 Tax=Parnassius apollo TaxID=110799 RepID=A0A8S3YHA9_PARAO|nr:unnamed protein product [Parnassius apollo]
MFRRNQRVQQNGKGFEWSWQLSPVDSVPANQFYVQLSQPVQGVQYASNAGVLQNIEPIPDGSGQATVGYNHAVPVQIYESPSLPNNTQIIHNSQSNGNSAHTPVDIYLLQQQFPLPVYQTVQGSLPGDLIHYNNIKPNLFSLNTLNPTGYNFQTNHLITNSQQAIEPQNSDRSSKEMNPIISLQEIDAEENYVPLTSVVQVFRDHNCSNEDLKTANEFNNNMQKSTELVAEIPTYKQNINENFREADQQNEPLFYKGATNFKIEQPRDNTNNVGYYYYSTETSPISTGNTNTREHDGISRLVASTQDLISNDDLLRINHSAEKHVTEIYDDYIKPRSRFNLKSEETRYIENPRNHIKVKAKISNIENRVVDSSNNDASDKIQQDNYESGKFTSPIVVQEFSDADYKEQVLNTLVSTMTPYIENGYEIVNIKKDSKGNYTKIFVPHYFNEEIVYVTPRPIGQRYLAPITVALRLLNSNHTDLNSIDDHDTSDTEIVEETVKSPSKERTIVEVQQSIPLDITHINDVEVHEYLEEGRSNSNPFDVAKTLYNTYKKVLQFTKKNEENINEVLNKYNNKDSGENSDSNYDDVDPSDENNQETKEKLEPSENVQSEVQLNINSDDINNNGYENENYYSKQNANGREAIQPVIIEKEVSVPQYLDHYIEKQVPDRMEVVKQVPVDRPVPVPVPYEKVIEKPVEVTKYIEKPYPVQVPQPYPVAVKVPYPVEQKVYIDRPVQIPYPVEKLVEKEIIKTVPVPTPVAVPFKVHVPVEKPVLYPVPIEKPILVPIEKPIPVEKIVHKEVPVPYPVEKTILYPVPYEKKVHVPYPVEKQVPFPVEKIVEKPVPVTQVVEKPVHVNVPVPVPIHIVKHYPVDRIVEKKIPYFFPVDRIVQKRVPVKVPYPVEKVVQKPVVLTKYIDRPYPVETKVPHIVEKIIEKKLPYAVQIPYAATSSTHGNSEQESQNLLHYHQYHSQSKQNPYPVQNIQDHQAQQGYLNQYYQYLKERQQTYSVPVQTTQWGKLYASSFKYLNVTPEDNNDTKKINDVTYLTVNENTYYGPPPVQFYDSMWEKNNNQILEAKLKRSDRTPKVTNIRLEYGFKPPLIPSTEVDLDGRPINKESET